MEPFTSREIRFAGVRDHGAWSLKLYSVRHDGTPVDWPGFEWAIETALAALPDIEPAEGRPGLGLLVAHQGRTGDYLVLGWWNHENELPIEIWVRRRGGPWRPAERGESFCVWDLEVLWAEREAWVQTMLGEAGEGGREAYLSRVQDRFSGADA